MSDRAREIRQLKLSAVFALVLCGLGGGLVWWTQRETRFAENALRQADRALDEIARKLRQFSAEEQEILMKSAYFRELEKRRVIGPAQRLDWIELIEAIRTERQLFEIDYEISEQKTDGAPIGAYRLQRSDIDFRLPLLHEGDLLGFLAELRARAPALVQVRQCQIARLPPPVERHSGDPQLDARCRVRLHTVGPPAQGEGGNHP